MPYFNLIVLYCVLQSTSHSPDDIEEDDDPLAADLLAHTAHHRHHRGDVGDNGVPGAGVDDILSSFPSRAYDKAEEIARRVWEAGWTVVHHQHLPKWLRDNDFLIKGHRPPLHSFYACFKSIFRIHTETGNIWTHLLGKQSSYHTKNAQVIQPMYLLSWKMNFQHFPS